jgi:hypothetical protein
VNHRQNHYTGPSRVGSLDLGDGGGLDFEGRLPGLVFGVHVGRGPVDGIADLIDPLERLAGGGCLSGDGGPSVLIDADGRLRVSVFVEEAQEVDFGDDVVETSKLTLYHS